MTAIIVERIKSFLLQFSVSAVVTGVFVWLFIQRHPLIFLLGLLIGAQVFTYIFLFEHFLKKRLRNSYFMPMLLFSTVMYVLIIISSVFISFVILNKFDLEFLWSFDFKSFILSTTMMYGLIFGLIMSFLFNAYSMFDTLLGKNFLLRIFTGRYHNPFEEKRIFMFLDMKSSTMIAERIGHKAFLHLLNDFFLDLSSPVIATKGEIYKYVGDEAIITWKMKPGLKMQSPVRCFYLFEEKINQRKNHYLTTYGLVPQFKAGVHGGMVVTGELGYTKKEITFLGDVLNTTARIESVCNEFDQNLIISDELLQMMNLPDDYTVTPLGEMKFRGKERTICISAVEKKN